MMSATVVHRYFLYAEDDVDDQELLTEMVASLDMDVALVICDQGLALMQYLEGLKRGDLLPCCIVLDINMPIWDGLRTLQELKKHAHFKQLPVLMYSTSNSSRDQERAKILGAEGFITKPASYEEMKAIITRFAPFGESPAMMR